MRTDETTLTTTNDRGPIDAAVDYARLRRRLPSPRTRRQIRERAGVRQIDLARELGVTRVCVCRWERAGDRTPRGALLVAYVKLLERLVAGSLMNPA